MLNKVQRFIFLALLFISYESNAQFLVPEQGNDTIRVCSGTVSDRANPFLPCIDGRDGTLTIYPGTPGYKIKLTFKFFQTYEEGDFLFIHNGTNISQPLIGKYYLGQSPLVIFSSDSSGAFTLHFKTIYNSFAKGFSAVIECVAPGNLPDLMASKASETYYYSNFPAFETTGFPINVINFNKDSVLTDCISYVSNDELLDASDILIDTEYELFVPANKTELAYASFNVDSMNTPGQHFTIIKLDHLDTIQETDKQNNIMAIPFQEDSSFVDLSPYSVNLQGAISRGNWKSVSISLFNGGNSISSAFDSKLYFSNDTVIDNSDVMLANFHVGYLGQSIYDLQIIQNGGVYFPATIALGKRYLFLVVDDSSQVAESNESNNIYRKEVIIDANFVDLSILNAGLSSNDIAPGGKVGIFYDIVSRNIPNNNYFVGNYLSADSILDASDSLLYASYVSASSNNISIDISIPINAQIGNQYLILKIDNSNFIQETNENNNMYTIPIKLVPPRFDLQYEERKWSTYGGYVNNHFSSGTGMVLSFDAYNQGNAKTDSCKVGFFLSQDSHFDTSDATILIRTIPMLNPNTKASVTLGGYWAVPNWLTNGKYYVLTILDVFDSIGETNELNNVHIDTVFIVSRTIDISYYANQVLPSRILAPGDSVRVNGYLKSGGINPLTTMMNKIYLSADKLLDASDTLLKTYNYWDYFAPVWVSNSPFVHIPLNLQNGLYYLVYDVDVTNVYSETNENNNRVFFPISICNTNAQYDSIPPGTPDTLTVCYDNIICDTLTNGTLTLLPSLPGNKLSLDILKNEITGGSVILYDGMDTLAPVITDFNYNYNGINIPTYYSSNSSGALTLKSKRFNILYHPSFSAVISCVDSLPPAELIIKPNFSTEYEFLYKAGDAFSKYYSIINSGGSVVDSSKVGFYLSTNDSLDSNDLLLDSISLGKILSGHEIGFNKVVLLPAGLADGEYYLFYKADYYNQITESDELNNSGYCILKIQSTLPDLTIRDVKFNTYPFDSNPYEIKTKLNLRNLGGVCSDSIFVGIYISIDSLLDASDISLGLGYSWNPLYSALILGSFDNFKMETTIPLTIPFGNYFLLFKIDPKNKIQESDESNNIINHPIRLVPRIADIELISFDAKYFHNSLTNSCRIENIKILEQGNWANFQYSAAAFYLSSDTLIDASDIVLDTTMSVHNHPYYYNFNISAPPGDYYLICKLDYKNSIAELDESNNLRYTSLTVTDSTYDLAFRSSTIFRKTVLAGKEIAGRACYANQGGASANARFEIYISTDTTIDAADSMVTHGYFQNNYDLFYYRFIIKDNTPPGLYYIIIKADANDSIDEKDESNNITFLPLYVLSNYKDLTFKSISLSSHSVAPGYTVVANAMAYNHGNVPLNSSMVGYYLSFDSLFDSNDLLLDHSFEISLDPGSYSYKNTTLKIPSTAAIGNYYILFYIDDSNQIIENNENNNIRAVPFVIGAPYIDLNLNPPMLSNNWLTAGAVVNTTVMVLNSGNVFCSSSNISYYFSTDTLLDLNDILLVNSTVNALPANGSETRNQSLNIPASTDTGNYYILFVADYLQQVAESNELNNKKFVPVNISLVGIKEAQANENQIAVSNPFQNELKIVFTDNSKKSIIIYDIAGSIVFKKTETMSTNMRINSSNWAEGVYFISVKQDKKEIRKKVIKLN